MTLPTEAKLEADLGGGVALYDVSRLLARTSREKGRDPRIIERAYHHHSGALGLSGFAGLERSARYVVEKRDFPGPAYTYWLAFEPDLDGEARMVVYRAQRDGVISWHTGGLNLTGIAVCWQGNLRKVKPTAAQRRMAERLALYLEQRHPGIVHSYHSEADRYGGRAKAGCPGPHVEMWVNAWRETGKTEFGTRP